MFWKLVLTRQYTWLNTPDAGNLLLPWFQLQASDLHRLAFTFWDPYQWCGQPLIGQGQAGTAYPLNWLLWALPMHNGWLRHVYLNWYLVMIHFQAAGFAYWLARDLGRSTPAAWFAGLAFSVGPFLGVSDWPTMLNAAVWAPLILLFFLRAFRGESVRQSAVFSGAALGMAWLSGSDQIPLLLTIVFAGLWIWRAIELREWSLLPIFAGVAAGVSAFQALPTLEYIGASPDVWWKFLASTLESHAVSPMSIPGVVAPQYAMDAMLFAGWTLLTFAAIGLWTGHRSREARLLAALGLGGLLISFGHYIVFEGILYSLRGLAREPKAGLVLFGLCAAILSAYGLDACREMLDSTASAARRIALALAGMSALCWVALLLLAMTGGDDFKRFTPLALCSIGALMMAGLLEAWRRGAVTPRAGTVCAILLAMWEFGNVTGSNWANVEFGWGWLTQLSSGSDVVQYLNSQATPVRVDTSGVLHNFGDWNGVEQFDGWSGGTQNIVRVAQYPSARALAGVNFTVGNKPPRPGQAQIYDSPRGMKIYSNPEAAPRAFVSHRVITANTPDELNYMLTKPVAELRANAFVTGPAPKIEACEGAEPASILWRKGRSIRVKAALTCTGLLVLSQTYYPGWHVSVDGKETQLYEAYGFLQSTVVPAGVHEVTFTYRPKAAWWGAAITFLTLIAVGALAWFSKRQRTD